MMWTYVCVFLRDFKTVQPILMKVGLIYCFIDSTVRGLTASYVVDKNNITDVRSCIVNDSQTFVIFVEGTTYSVQLDFSESFVGKTSLKV